MIQILYDSMSGNTRKLADAMAEELGVKAADAKSATLEQGDGVLFLGSGCYGGVPGKNMVKFIETHDFRGKRVALFGTSGGGTGMETKAMEKALRGKGASVLGSFNCKGKVLPALNLINLGRPDAADLAAARKFAKEMAGLK